MANIVSVSKEQVAERAAQWLAGHLRKAMHDSGIARFAIAGGSAITPLSLLRNKLDNDWNKVRLTWVDERCVDLANPDSNRGTAYRSGALSEEQPVALELPLWLDGEQSEAALARVHSGLSKDFRNGLDVALLGMGPDGHIASLFPGHPALKAPASEFVVAISDSPKPPSSRISLTRTLLERTGHSLLVALGEAKTDALKRLVQADPSLPASHIPNLTILTNIDLGAKS